MIVLAWLTTMSGSRKFLPTKPTGSVSPISVISTRGHASFYPLANWIRSQGYNASAYPGPSADALLLIPPAIASGLGELGKHGSLISRRFRSGVRLAGVTTDMPLVASAPDRFGADEFCATCQVCTNAVLRVRLPNTSRWCGSGALVRGLR